MKRKVLNIQHESGAFAPFADDMPREETQESGAFAPLSPPTSQRAIADMVGVSHPTIAGDLGRREGGKKLPHIDVIPGEIEIENGKELPPATPPDDYDPVKVNPTAGEGPTFHAL